MAASDIYIEATGADSGARARTAVHEAHQRLRTRLATLSERQIVSAAGRSDSGQLIDFCLRELREYLGAAERHLYEPASGRTETRLLVDALRAGAAALIGQVDELAGATSADAGPIAQTIAMALDLHLAIEESVLLPALADLPGVNLSLLAAELEALLSGERIETPTVIDVRHIARGGRHPRVFARYARLAPGESFILVHSHDPKPLRGEFEAIYADAYSWDYLHTGPEEWRVRIGKVAVDV